MHSAVKTLSSTCLAIAIAAKNGSLTVTAHQGRLGQYWAICDSVGVIETHTSAADAQARIKEVAGE